MVFELFVDGEMFRYAIPRFYGEGGVFWGRCYFGVLRCWDVDRRGWGTGSGWFSGSVLSLDLRAGLLLEYWSLWM
jgi:hypothetical protein